MNIAAWHLWFVLALVCLVAEIFTGGFFILWFGIGAAAAGALALAGIGEIWQWTAFIVVSGACVLASKKLMVN